MPIKKTSRIYKVIEEELEKNNVVSSSDDEEPIKEPVVKPKRVQSDKQRAAFKKKGEKRAELVLIRKAEKDKEMAKYEN